jgi:hypothetical protein
MEYVPLTDAIQYIRHKTGKQFHQRSFTRYTSLGVIEINGQLIVITRIQINTRWEIARQSVEAIITAILAPE